MSVGTPHLPGGLISAQDAEKDVWITHDLMNGAEQYWKHHSSIAKPHSPLKREKKKEKKGVGEHE
jgi:hypothetical protein